MRQNLYHYRAFVKEVIDVTTVMADVDLGFSVWRGGKTLFLNRISAPKTDRGKTSKSDKAVEFLRKILIGKEVTIETVRTKHNTRDIFLTEMWIKDRNNKRRNVNDLLVEKGFAQYKR